MNLVNRARQAAGHLGGIHRRAGVVLPLALAFVVLLASVAYGAVWTDQDDYTPGSVVTISGDNSSGGGYLAGEIVAVDVLGPNGYTASCEGVADAAGAWTCQITLWADELAVGDYTFTATGQTSGVSENGAFTDGHTTTVIQSGPSGTVTSTSATFTWKAFAGPVELTTFQSQCSLDGGAFAACISGQSYSGLSNGAHSFTVRSRTGPGDSGSWGTPDTRNWTVASDSTAPTVNIALTGPNGGTPDGAAGWFKTKPVTGTVTATDSTSNIAELNCNVSLSNVSGVGSAKTASGDFSISDEGTTTISCTAKDAANNTSSPATTQNVKIDTVAPAVAIALDSPNGGTPDGAAGWFKTKPVTGTVSATDATSGVASIDCTGVTLTGLTGLGTGSASGNFSISAEGMTSISCTASDTASNTSNPATTQNVKIDTVAPDITDAGPTAGPDGNAGWYKSAVTNQFSASDPTPGSGLAGPANFTKSSGTDEGSNVKIASGPVSDVASNTNAGIDSAAFKIDLTNPTVTCGLAPTFLLNQAGAQVSATVTDGQSGPAASPVTGSANTSTIGSYTAPVTGFDVAGRSTTVDCGYSVIYNFTGFFQPVDNPGPGPSYVYNRVKAGSAIPVKFSLNGNQGLNILAAGYPKSVGVPCPNNGTYDMVEQTVAAANSGLTYDEVKDQYNYVWKSEKGWAGTCRKLTVRLADGTDHVAYFHFTK